MGPSRCRKTGSGFPLILHYGQLYNYFIIYNSVIKIETKCTINVDFPGGTGGKESICQCRRPGFDPWVGNIPWRRAWQPTLVFLLGEFHGQRSLVCYSPSMGSQRVGHDWSDFTQVDTHNKCNIFESSQPPLPLPPISGKIVYPKTGSGAKNVGDCCYILHTIILWNEYVCVCLHAKLLQSCLTLCDCGLEPTRLLSPWDSHARILSCKNKRPFMQEYWSGLPYKVNILIYWAYMNLSFMIRKVPCLKPRAY